MSVTVKFISADQNWTEESTTYWFELNGSAPKTNGYEFNNDVYGVCESGADSSILDADGYPQTEGDDETIAVRNFLSVTDSLRNKVSGLS
ncbi:MAG: hypothetical protein GY799_29540 [Desulfobulbaceae bacterium]|nr:hypothetical protein [Desulfobulbaceae bacterium]